jgi:rod shape-determining protein MreB and related proteins
MSFLRSIQSFSGSRDMAIDLGTANTLVFVRGQGIVVSEPSVVAVDASSGAVHAVGDDAKRMIGRTPATISAIRPLRHGVIADFEVTEQMLRHFIRKVHRSRLAHPRVVMCAPSGITDVEKRAIVEASLSAGARRVSLIEEPIAAAIGAGIAIEEPIGNMVVDVGGGTSEVAVISLGGIVVFESVRTGGYDLDEALISHVREEHGITIGQQTAERIKFEIGSAWPLDEDATAEVKGRDLVSGLPKTVTLTGAEARRASEEPLRQIINTIKETLERTPPELAADVAERGIMLAGGGSLLKGFDVRVGEETKMETRLADSPLTCVVIGSGRSLEEFDVMGPVGPHTRRRRLGRR